MHESDYDGRDSGCFFDQSQIGCAAASVGGGLLYAYGKRKPVRSALEGDRVFFCLLHI